MEQQQQLRPKDLLEKGLFLFRKLLDSNPVAVTREEMCTLINFEVTVAAVIENLQAAEGKTPEELLELAKKAIPQQ